MDDINDLLNEAKAAAARRAAIEREAMLQAEREARDAVPRDPTDEARDARAEGRLTVERRQGQWRCYLAGERIRSGEAIEVYVNETVGWVRGSLLWGRRPTTPPSIRVEATDPHRIDEDGRPLPVGEFELLLPEDVTCRRPETP